MLMLKADRVFQQETTSFQGTDRGGGSGLSHIVGHRAFEGSSSRLFQCPGGPEGEFTLC